MSTSITITVKLTNGEKECVFLYRVIEAAIRAYRDNQVTNNVSNISEKMDEVTELPSSSTQ
jgi:hypothetical protein